MNTTIAQLREGLSRLHGPARVPMLERLWRELSMCYLRTGPGNPAGLGDLSAAIEAMYEAHHLMEAGSPAHRQVAGQLGWFLSIRYGMHGGGEADRDAAMALLAAALDRCDLPSELMTVARVSLGKLHLDRVIQGMDSTAHRGSSGRRAADPRTDVDEAIRQFRTILDGPSVSTEVIGITRLMLDLAEALRPGLSGAPGGFHDGRIGQALAAMQQVMHTGLPGSSLSSPLLLPPDLAKMDPLDLPVAVMQGDPAQVSAIPPRRPAAAPRTSVDPDLPRRAVRNRLAALTGSPDKPVWEQARELLVADPGRMAAGDLDAYLGAAASAVAAEEAGDPVEAGLDRLLSAIGLCLRERREGSGWADGVVSGTPRTAAELLLAAATRIPATHPAAAVVVEALGGVLDRTRPLAGAIVEVAGPLGQYAAEVTTGSATASALGALCRTVAALTAGADVDPDRLAAAVAAVPADHAWYPALATAVGQVRLAAAVRAGGAGAVDAAVEAVVEAVVEADPDGLTALLDALLRDDAEALRAAVDACPASARAPRLAAVLGGALLELAIRAPVPERDDLAAAIELLAASAGALDDAHRSLRTRTWWRLAQAYRRRGAPTDADWCRDAGLEALRDGDLDPRSAARFAGWMLADGRAAEAYTALETAAAGAARPGSAAGPLAEDVLDLILGIDVNPGGTEGTGAARPPGVPAWTEVAAAVRKVGASALLYLHPTDGAGRTIGVLCIDPATGRPEVLANVPVTDPLTSDDPGWSAIVSRWSGGGLLVAATGDLRRIALPAVLVGDGRRLAQDASLGYVASGAQLVELAGRARAPVERAPLFVVNPRGDRDAEMADVLALQRLFYPRAVSVGRALETVAGAGTRQDVLARLPGASLVHLACGLLGSQLQLAGAEVLDVTAARGSGLVVLTECAAEGFGPSAEVFLGAGFSGVIGWQWPVPAPFAALALFMTHLMLVDDRLPPARAVAATQQWLLDPDRDPPPVLPGVHRHTLETTDLTRPALWAALAYSGC